MDQVDWDHHVMSFVNVSSCMKLRRQDVEALYVSMQFLELIYLLFQRRWFYPALCLSLFVATGIIFSRFKKASERKVMNLINAVRLVPIVDCGFVRTMSSHRLVPGDVIVLQRGRALCDMVLLRGTCLVVEATLSGEVCITPGEGYIMLCLREHLAFLERIPDLMMLCSHRMSDTHAKPHCCEPLTMPQASNPCTCNHSAMQKGL